MSGVRSACDKASADACSALAWLYARGSGVPKDYARAYALLKRACDQFDRLYAEGAARAKFLSIAIHPYITGVPHRIGALDAALDYICRHDGVWRATGSEICRHYLAQQGKR